MSEIYIITQGTYSDYMIVTIFKERADAEKFVKAFPACNIEEFDFSDASQMPLNKKAFEIYMERNGDVRSTWEAEGYDFEKVFAGMEELEGGILKKFVFANDKDHAIKIVNERRVRLIAENKWPEKKEERK